MVSGKGFVGCTGERVSYLPHLASSQTTRPKQKAGHPPFRTRQTVLPAAAKGSRPPMLPRCSDWLFQPNDARRCRRRETSHSDPTENRQQIHQPIPMMDVIDAFGFSPRLVASPAAMPAVSRPPPAVAAMPFVWPPPPVVAGPLGGPVLAAVVVVVAALPGLELKAVRCAEYDKVGR